MYINEEWTDKVKLIDLDGNTTDPNELKVVWANFRFYDCTYTAAVSLQDILEDIPRTALEGDSILFDSFDNFLESDENWEKLKSCFQRYKNYLIELDNV